MDQIGSNHLTELAGEAFFGNGLDRTRLETRFLTNWKPNQVCVELERIGQTWFDYRFAHPVLRSHFFYFSYTLAWRRAYNRFYDSDADVSHCTPWAGGRRSLYRNKTRTISQVIDTMHFVDEMCIPYDVFFDACFEHFMQEREFTSVWNKKGVLKGLKLPPARLFRDGQAAIFAQTRFERISRRRLFYSTHPFYNVANWQGLPWQKEHMRWLCNEANQRGAGSAPALSALVYNRKVLSENMVARVFGLEMIKSIRSIRSA